MSSAQRWLPGAGLAGLAAVAIVGVLALGWAPAVLAVPLVILAVVTVRVPAVGILGLAAFLPFNALATDVLSTQGRGAEATYIGAAKDVALAALVIAVFTTGAFRRIPRDLLVAVTAFLLIGALAAVNSLSLGQAAYGWRNNFLPAVLILVIPPLLDTTLVRRVVVTLAVSMNAAAAVAIATWTAGVDWLYTTGQLPVAEGENFPGTFFVHNSDQPRAFSPFTGPNELGVAMAIVIAVVLCYAAWTWRTRILLSLLPVAALVLSQSRSGQVGFIAVVALVVVWHVWRANRTRALVLIGAAGVLGLIAVVVYAAQHAGADGDPSLGGHASSLTEAVRMILAEPFGYGLGQAGPRAGRFTDEPILVESFWLLLALEAGILALVIFAAILVRIVHLSLRAGTLPALTAAAVIAAALVSQMVLPTLQDTATAFLMWIGVAIGLHAAAAVAAARSDSVKAPGL